MRISIDTHDMKTPADVLARWAKLSRRRRTPGERQADEEEVTALLATDARWVRAVGLFGRRPHERSLYKVFVQPPGWKKWLRFEVNMGAAWALEGTSYDGVGEYRGRLIDIATFESWDSYKDALGRLLLAVRKASDPCVDQAAAPALQTA